MTDDISKVVLKPCPFCGGRAERIDFGPGSGDNEGGSCISCTGCQSSGPVEYGRKENFVSTWNRRLESATTPAEVDGLCEQLQQKCSDWGTYWRAPDAHGVNLSMDQALELLRDALGVEVDIAQAADLPAVPDAAKWAKKVHEFSWRLDAHEQDIADELVAFLESFAATPAHDQPEGSDND